MPYCASCGTQMPDDAAACPNCGRPVATTITTPVAGTTTPVAVRRTDGQAIAALVLGIAGLTACPFICSIVAVILGTQAKARLEADPTLEGEGMARAGTILGWVGIGLGALWIVFFLFTFLLPMVMGGGLLFG